MSSSKPPLRSLDASVLTLVPPTTESAENVVCARSLLAASWICWASSRVGDRMSAEMPERGCGGERSSCSTMGVRKATDESDRVGGSVDARVLPVPVLARARTSLPASAGPMLQGQRESSCDDARLGLDV